MGGWWSVGGFAKDRPLGVVPDERYSNVLWAHANEEGAGMLAECVTKLCPQDRDCRRKPGVRIVPREKRGGMRDTQWETVNVLTLQA